MSWVIKIKLSNNGTDRTCDLFLQRFLIKFWFYTDIRHCGIRNKSSQGGKIPQKNYQKQTDDMWLEKFD